MVTVRTQVKEMIKEAGIDNLSNDFMDRLDRRVESLILESVKRAKENNRKTVMGKDI